MGVLGYGGKWEFLILKNVTLGSSLEALGIPGMSCPLTFLLGCSFPALRPELHVQGSHEHPQHALHWPLHRGDGPQADCLQTQGRSSRSRFPWPTCACACVWGSCEEKEEVKLSVLLPHQQTELGSCFLDWSLTYI